MKLLYILSYLLVNINALSLISGEKLQNEHVFSIDKKEQEIREFNEPKDIYNDSNTACKIARRMVSNSTRAIINTIYEMDKNNEDEESLIAMSFSEYAIDCFQNGNPIFLFIKMSRTWRNIAMQGGCDSSLTYETRDVDEVNAEWPGSVSWSMYGLPRVNLRGHFRELRPIEKKEETDNMGNEGVEIRYISEEEVSYIKQCFQEKHSETESWFPGDGNRVHQSMWTEFVVESGYFVGGFGGYAYIGELDGDEYNHLADMPSSLGI